MRSRPFRSGIPARSNLCDPPHACRSARFLRLLCRRILAFRRASSPRHRTPSKVPASAEKLALTQARYPPRLRRPLRNRFRATPGLPPPPIGPPMISPGRTIVLIAEGLLVALRIPA